MKTKAYAFSWLAILLSAITLISCVDNNETPPDKVEFKNGQIVTVDQVKALYSGELAKPWQQRMPVKIENDWSLRGIITASDKKDGNLYKEAFIQDQTTGLRLLFDATSGLYPGDSVVINLKNLYLGDYGDFIQLGGIPYVDASGNRRVSGMNMDRQVLKLSIGNPTVPQLATIAGIKSAAWLGKLVRLENVQFEDDETGKTWADAQADPPAAANRYLTDCSNRSVIVRTSGYASFAGNILPGGKGTLVAIVTKFNNDYQLLVRDYSEVNLTGDRCGYIPQPLGEPVETFSQNFESFADNASIYISGWQNLATAGGRIWLAKLFSGNRYAQATGYNSGLSTMVTWLITPPVKLSTQKVLNFQTAKAYWAHTGNRQPLEVFISTDYNGSNPGSATWTALSAKVAGKADPDNTFIASGAVSLPMIAGKSGVIAFRYTGSDTESTTIRIDNIVVSAN